MLLRTLQRMIKMDRVALCPNCKRRTRHNQRNECINCVTNKQKKVIESDTTSV